MKKDYMMKRIKKASLFTATAISIFSLTACNDSTPDIATNKTTEINNIASTGIDLTMFKTDAFTQTPKIVDCETAEGTATTCYEFVTSGAPAGREPGPFCPRTTSDGPEKGGAWFSKEGTGDLVDITGEFILKLSDYYGDEKWVVYDKDTNKVRYTATKAACLGAARPDVEEQYKQNCIECELSYLDDDFSLTYLIPVTPIPAATPGRVRTVGIALDGSELSGPAPIDAILGSYTIAAFDDCGGHINVHQGYHYHSTTGCTDQPVTTDDGHAPLIGYASDGYGIYAMKDAEGKEEILDECRGTTDDIRGYHYHVASPSENMFIGCMHGETVAPVGGPAGGPPDGARPPKNH
jgi:hypothetical protein